MQAKLFTIPVFDGDAFVAELNRFLAAQRILAVDRQLVQAGTSSACGLGEFRAGGRGMKDGLALKTLDRWVGSLRAASCRARRGVGIAGMARSYSFAGFPPPTIIAAKACP